jgi:hypothetical protein
MQIDRSIFMKLMLGAFGLIILGFFTRGISLVVVGKQDAQLIAAPVFILAVLLAFGAFVLAVLVKIGVLNDVEPVE